MSANQMEEIQKSLALLLSQNQKMSEKIDALERENKEMKQGVRDTQARLETNKVKWIEVNKEADELFKRMSEIQAALTEDLVDEQFLTEHSVRG